MIRFFLDPFWGVDDLFLESNIRMSDDSRVYVLCCRKICFCWKRRAVQEISQSWPVPPRVLSSTVRHPQHGVALAGRKIDNEGDVCDIRRPSPSPIVVNLPSYQRNTLQRGHVRAALIINFRVLMHHPMYESRDEAIYGVHQGSNEFSTGLRNGCDAGLPSSPCKLETLLMWCVVFARTWH